MYFSTFLRVFINCKEKCGENQNFNRSLLFLTHFNTNEREIKYGHVNYFTTEKSNGKCCQVFITNGTAIQAHRPVTLNSTIM